MGDTAINMRDPIFYRWHSYIDDIFHEYKATLPGYNVQNVKKYHMFLKYFPFKIDGFSFYLFFS